MRGAEANAYAAGLYELALEKKKVPSFQEEMKEVLTLFRDSPELLETPSKQRDSGFLETLDAEA